MLEKKNFRNVKTLVTLSKDTYLYLGDLANRLNYQSKSEVLEEILLNHQKNDGEVRTPIIPMEKATKKIGKKSKTVWSKKNR